MFGIIVVFVFCLTISFFIIGNAQYSNITVATHQTILDNDPNTVIKVGDSGLLNFKDITHIAPTTNLYQFMTVLAGINFSYSMSMNLFPIFSGLKTKTN